MNSWSINPSPGDTGIILRGSRPLDKTTFTINIVISPFPSSIFESDCWHVWGFPAATLGEHCARPLCKLTLDCPKCTPFFHQLSLLWNVRINNSSLKSVGVDLMYRDTRTNWRRRYGHRVTALEKRSTWRVAELISVAETTDHSPDAIFRKAVVSLLWWYWKVCFFVVV